MLLLQLNLQAATGTSASSATTDSLEVTAAQVTSVISAAASATDGNDTTSASVSALIASISAKTDGPEATTAQAAPLVGISGSPIDGAEITSASASPTVAAGSAKTDSADITAAAVEVVTVPATSTQAGRGSERYGMALDALIAEKNAAQAIARVAIQQVDKSSQSVKTVKTAKRVRQLRREIERSGLAWNAFYADLLGQARGQVLTEQIRAQFNDRQLEALALQQQIAGLVAEQIRMDDDDEALALLLCL